MEILTDASQGHEYRGALEGDAERGTGSGPLKMKGQSERPQAFIGDPKTSSSFFF